MEVNKISRDILSLPKHNIAVVCYEKAVVDALRELYPEWLYITSPVTQDELAAITQGVHLVAAVGRTAVREFPYKTGTVLDYGTPCCAISETGTYSVLKQLCGVYYSKDNLQTQEHLSALPETGVLVVGGTTSKINFLKRHHPNWWYVEDFNTAVLNETQAWGAEMVILLDEHLLDSYCMTCFGVRGTPVIVKKDGGFVTMKRVFEPCDSSITELLL